MLFNVVSCVCFVQWNTLQIKVLLGNKPMISCVTFPGSTAHTSIVQDWIGPKKH